MANATDAPKRPPSPPRPDRLEQARIHYGADNFLWDRSRDIKAVFQNLLHARDVMGFDMLQNATLERFEAFVCETSVMRPPPGRVRMPPVLEFQMNG